MWPKPPVYPNPPYHARLRPVPISAKTCRIVEAAARSLGYKPNYIARSLITRSTRIIGIAINRLWNPIFAQVLDEFSRQLLAAGYNSMLLNFPTEGDLGEALDVAIQYRVDGIILTAANI